MGQVVLMRGAIAAVLIVGVLICAGFVIVGAAKAQDYTVHQVPGTDPSGTNQTAGNDTVAVNNDTGQTIRSHYAGAVIQAAINSANGGSVFIQAGDYDIKAPIIDYSSSIRGVGNDTRLIANASIYQAVIEIHKSPSGVSPNGLTIKDMEIDGSAQVQAYANTIRGIEVLDATNIHIQHIFAHNIISGQGVYMSNAQHCYVNDSWFSNIGNNLGVGNDGNYGSGVSFGEMRTPAASYDTINNCTFSYCSMSDIDLEPANHITITNNRFTDAATWKNVPNPVITVYPINGYASDDGNVIAHNYVNGSFGEFVYLDSSSGNTITDNWVKYTASEKTAIYCLDSTTSQIISNTIGTLSQDCIGLVNCQSYSVQANVLMDMEGAHTNYGVHCYASGGTSSYNDFSSNDLTGWLYGISVNNNHNSLEGNVFHGCSNNQGVQ
jgi:hypothetical protein